MKDPLLTFRLICRLFLSLLRDQMHRWQETISISLRFVVAFVCLTVTAWMNSVLGQLPTGWFDALLENLFTLRGIYCAVVILIISLLGCVYGIVGAKVARSL